ncbi:MAG: hypothetical protein H0T79_01750 [Deltaproteobacteria bacterium]|nr:hypothetical protein [Deltaproteobacteria bacterium]
MPNAPTAVLLGDLNMLRCFAGTDVPVIVVSTDPSDITLRSRHAHRAEVIAPFTNPERALADLESIAAPLEDRPILFYSNDEQLLFVSRHRERLTRSYRVRMPSAELIEALVDKRRFGRFAQTRGLPVPRQVSSREVDGPDAALARLRLPVVIKPDVHIGWFAHAELHGAAGPRKAIVSTTADELRAHWAEISAFEPNFIAQEFIPGAEDQVFSFHAYVDTAETVRGWFVGRKVRTFPREAGISTYLELADEPRVAALGFEVLRRSGVIGPVKLDFKHDPHTGALYLLDVNARFNLWHRLGAAAGVNLPLLAYDDLAHTTHMAPVKKYATDIRWLSFGDDLRSFLRSYRPTGALDVRSWLRSLRGRKIYDVFAWDDPMPLVASLKHYATSLVRRVAGGRLAPQQLTGAP